MGALFHLESVMFELEICQIQSLLGWIERCKFFYFKLEPRPRRRCRRCCYWCCCRRCCRQRCCCCCSRCCCCWYVVVVDVVVGIIIIVIKTSTPPTWRFFWRFLISLKTDIKNALASFWSAVFYVHGTNDVDDDDGDNDDDVIDIDDAVRSCSYFQRISG